MRSRHSMLSMLAAVAMANHLDLADIDSVSRRPAPYPTRMRVDDPDAIAAAEAKRARKNAKRLASRGAA